MKNLILLSLLLTFPLLILAQYSNEIVTGMDPRYYYIGSLSMAPDNLSNFEKIKIDIFGGAWGANAIGETTFYIANRGGLVINETLTGGGNDNMFVIKAYKNGSNTDIYIGTTTSWAAFTIKACKLGGNATQLLPIEERSLVGDDITPVINPVMITDYYGNISLGTNNSYGYRFSVNGNIRAKEIKVETTNWPDYVFTSSHKNQTLQELEAFIKTNNHLPEIPSAKEAETNGINLGEMNAKLLKKIEELTLYMIGLKKENDMQQAEIDKLKKNR